MRYGGALSIGCAYAGTANAAAVKKLLNLCVTDTNQEVRRISAAMLGLILSKRPEHLLELIKLLSESYNPHVRWGSAMALAFACCSSGSLRALDYLKVLKKDSNGFVRQAYWIAAAIIMCNIPLQHKTEQLAKEVKEFRESLEKACMNKHEETLSRYGALVAMGIVEAGGRNMQVRFINNDTGILNRTAIAGITLFMQLWFWFPTTAFLQLALKPTVLVALNEELNIPVGFSWNCKCKKS